MSVHTISNPVPRVFAILTSSVSRNPVGPGPRNASTGGAGGNSARSCSIDVDQREAGFGILSFAQVAGRLDQDDFERRADMPFDQMTANHTAVRFAENCVKVQCRTLIADCDIAEQR